MKLSMGSASPCGIDSVPYYRPGKRSRKPGRVALVIPHSNEIPATNQFRKALANRLMAEGMAVTARTETGMMRRGWDARRRIDSNFGPIIEAQLKPWQRAESEQKKLILEEKAMLIGGQTGMSMKFGRIALTAMLSMEDYARRAGVIAECMAGGEGMVVELHAMNSDADCWNAEIEAGFMRIRGTRTLFLPDAAGMMNQSFLSHRTDLAGDENVARAASEIAEVIGLDMENVFLGYFRARDRIAQMGGRVAVLELPSEWAALPAGHPMYGYYRDISRSDFENAYCEIVRKPVAFRPEELERVARAVGAFRG